MEQACVDAEKAARKLFDSNVKNFYYIKKLYLKSFFKCLILCRILQEGISCELKDLKTLLPWDKETVEASVRKTGRLLISHEAPVTGGFGAKISASIVERSFLRVSHFNPFSRYILMGIKKGTFKNRSLIN
ncbi:putative 3-methyl-2-oxobutanoate dehydrogenase (2-methylpropanoyl-transferring) [Helianthus annuus]|nr:putative 3-methyl-2-oxobutanoate dehydrogenase (2-methylpropanoyl-transferring) [Helianthus annuus]KAJ0883952.1 putative 3-methyl-2-oxobutanoate dehydrogenase (2-methylpropanoyl-transferring) [Helianthus annuus]